MKGLLLVIDTSSREFKSASGLIARGACCWSVDVLFFLFLILDFFKAKSPTFVGLFMDKKSMLRNDVENFGARLSAYATWHYFVVRVASPRI